MRRLIRYIHLNPLEAGLVGRPEKYFWSRHNAYFGRAAFTWLEMDRVLIHFGQNRTTAMISLAEFMMAHTDASEDIIKIEQAASALSSLNLRVGPRQSPEVERS